jgi:hypothetical protein
MAEPHAHVDLDKAGVDRGTGVVRVNAERSRCTPHDDRIACGFRRRDREKPLRR